MQVVRHLEGLHGIDNLLNFFHGILRDPNLGPAVFPKERVPAGAARIPRAQDLPQAQGLIRKDSIGQVQYVRSRPVVPFQADQSAFFKVLAKTVDVPDIRTAESVDGLVVIAHDKQRLPVSEQRPHKPVLRRVDVLIFVHQNLGPHLAEKIARLVARFQQAYRLVYQVFEHDHARRQDFFAQHGKLRLHSGTPRIFKQVFSVQRLRRNLQPRKAFQEFAVRRFLRDRRLFEADHLVGEPPADLLPQHIERKRMERTEPHARFWEKLLHALPHFGSRLRRKRKRQDFFGKHSRRNAVLNPLRQDRRLSRPRPRQYQELSARLVVVQHGRPLVTVETFQDALHIHMNLDGIAASRGII